MKSAAVIGGGFYACYLACELALNGVEVDLFEREDKLIGRASFWNQARVHGGYHYPRHTPTALRSRVNYPRFAQEFADCLKKDFKHIYGIAKANSSVSAKQFHHFMKKIGSPLDPVSKEHFKLFDSNMVEAAYNVEECGFNAELLRLRMTEKLKSSGVHVHVEHTVEKIETRGPERIALRISNPEFFEKEYDFVLNCTYCDLLSLNFSKKPSVLEFEIAELALIELPSELKGFGITLMCGPFFSTLPFPSTEYHSLSHVRYTPHLRWTSVDRIDSSQVLREYPKESRFEYMIRDAQRYVPLLKNARYVKSFFEVKTLLPQNSVNDGRPIFFEKDRDQTNFVSIMGGKIDNVYDIAERVKEEFLK
jgi:glycine/D-amino acid oxidase-like deaminating enzyme